MKIQTISVGMLSTNCYLLTGQKGCVLIDPGAQPEKVERALAKEGLPLEMILLTHGHYDHMGGVNQLKEQYPQVPVLIHEADEVMLKTPQYNFSIEISGEGYRTAADRLLADGEEVQTGNFCFRVLHTPGHTLGSVCYLMEDVIFTGDTVFCGGVGRTDLYGGSYPALAASVKKVAALEGNYTLYPGHGPATTLDAERRQNPYMGAAYDDLF